MNPYNRHKLLDKSGVFHFHVCGLRKSGGASLMLHQAKDWAGRRVAIWSLAKAFQLGCLLTGLTPTYPPLDIASGSGVEVMNRRRLHFWGYDAVPIPQMTPTGAYSWLPLAKNLDIGSLLCETLTGSPNNLECLFYDNGLSVGTEFEGDSGTRRDVLGNVRDINEVTLGCGTMRLQPELAVGLDGELESHLSPSLKSRNIPHNSGRVVQSLAGEPQKGGMV